MMDQNQIILFASYSAVSAAAILLSIKKWGRFYISAIIVGSPFLVFSLYIWHSPIDIPLFVFVLIASSLLYERLFYLAFIGIMSLFFINLAGFVFPVSWDGFDFVISISIIISFFFNERLRQINRNNENAKGGSKKIEIFRDIVQIGGGIVMLFIFFQFGKDTAQILITFIALDLYALGNYLGINRKSILARTIWFFERGGTELGIGAIWFATGVLLAFALVHGFAILAEIFFVLIIGDSLATIAGSSIKSPKLPYNRRKSVAGFTAIFLSSALFGFIIMGYAGIAIALIGAFAESISQYPFDDNLVIPLLMIVGSYLI
jgi:dolichol kinase